MGASLGEPYDTVTVSPTFLCKSASVAAPNTIWLLASSPWPLKIGGATLACGWTNRIGTFWPAICTLA